MSELTSIHPRLVRHGPGDYRTPDGHWQIINPRDLDNGLQRRWIIREYLWDAEPPGWFALDDDYSTLRQARIELAAAMPVVAI